MLKVNGPLEDHPTTWVINIPKLEINSILFSKDMGHLASNRMIFESLTDYIPFGDDLRMFLNCEEELIEAEEQGYMVQGRSKVE